MLTYSQIQHPRPKGEREFQEIVLKLLRHEWDDPHAILHGRSGQAQQGVDISGSDKRCGFNIAGCQCKGAVKNDPRQLSAREIEEEIEAAKNYEPKLDLFIVAYCGDRDAKLQKKARELNEANKANGLFEIALWSWDDIVDRAESFPEMRREMCLQDGYIGLLALDPKRQSADLVNGIAVLHTIADKLQAHLFADTASSASASPSDAVAEAKIDIWRDQIRAGQAAATIDPLRAFIATRDGNASPHVRFRAYGNLGAAFDHTGQHDEAIEAYEQAAKAEPDSAGGHAYKAQALIARGSKPEAFEEAQAGLRIDPEQRLAAVVLIEAAPPTVKTAELERRVAATVRYVDIASSLAARYSDEGQHDNALRIARAISDEKREPLKNSAIAQAILRKFERSLELRMGMPVEQEERELLVEARDLLEVAWTWAKSRADKSLWVYLAANLTAAYRFIGEEAKADSIALEAYELAPVHPDIMERAVVAFMHKGMVDEATKTAIKYAEMGRPRGALLAADIFAWSGNWAVLQAWAERAFEAASDDFDRARAAEHIVIAIQHTASPAEALVKSDSLRPNFPPSVGFEAGVAEAARRAGDKDALEAARMRLNSFDPGTLNPLERFSLANAYADEGEWARAADILDGLYSLDCLSEPLRQRLLYLYRADLRAKARAFYESLRGDALKSGGILRLGAAIYEKAGMLPQALAALNTALDLDKNDLGSRLDWVRLCIRANQEKKASRWIKKAEPDFDADPDDLMELAQLFDRFGRRPEAIALGYKTLRRHWGLSERLHLMYMSLFLMHSRVDSFLVSKTVAENTVVFLENSHGGTARYRIEAGFEPAQGVLAPDKPFAQRLMGMAVGDTAIIDEGIGQRETWKIVQIKHKFLDLFHDTLEAHATLFPGSRAFGCYSIEPNTEEGFEPLFEQVRARARVAEQAADIYKNELVPLDLIGKVLGLDVIDASRGLRFQSNLTLDVCIGNAPERDQAMMQLAGVKSVIVDPATLAIWQDIGLLAELDSVPDFEVCVVQATIDLLNSRVDKARSAAKQKGGVLEARGDKIAMIEPTKQEREAWVEHSAALLDWCRENAVLLPTEPLKGVEEATAVFSRSTIDTLGTLVETKLPAVIDDRRLRMFVSQLGAYQLGWTQALLMCWLNEQKISRTLYARLVAKLKAARAGFVSVSGEDLRAAVDSGDPEEFKDVVSALTIPTVEVHSLVGVVSGFIIALWTNPKYKDRRQRLTGLVLEILLCRRDGLNVIRAVIGGVHQNINHLLFAKMWLSYIEQFAVGHFIVGELLQQEKHGAAARRRK